MMTSKEENESEQQELQEPVMTKKVISFADTVEDNNRESTMSQFFEPSNFKYIELKPSSRKSREGSTSIETADTDNEYVHPPENAKKLRMRSRYSTFVSGINQFDPYQELTATQVAAFKQVFDMVDKDGGGSIDADELYQAMRDLEPGLKLDEISEILDELDQDGNGTIDFEEFLYMMTSMSMQIKEAAQHEDIMAKYGGRKRQSIFFSVITKFAMKHSLKEIERYYASKSGHKPHVVGHYAAGACVEGLTEKELRMTWKHLFLANKGKDSPYAQPLNFVMATTKKQKKSKKNNERKGKKINRMRSSPPEIFYHGHNKNNRNNRTNSNNTNRIGSANSLASGTMSPLSLPARSPSPRSTTDSSQCGWTPRHGLPITKVQLPMVIYNQHKNRKKLTIIDMDKIRDRVTVARNCYYNQLNLENQEKALKYWETLKIDEIPSPRLQRNFMKVFRAYSPTNEYENHIINESKHKSQRPMKEDIDINSHTPVLLRL